MPEKNETHRVRNDRARQAIIVAVQTPDQSDEAVDASCVELERLAMTLGISVVDREVQKRTRAAGSTFVGSGKLEELAEKIDAEVADMVLVDGELSPKQQRSFELATEVEVLDRTAVILRIFEQRAQTREAKIQVEIARLTYELPRQRDDGSGDDRRGGGGRGERGHTNVELSKERIRDRIAQLNGELDSVQEQDSDRRDRREDIFQAVLVGYTNAGKSTLMRALTGSEILVEDKLFATLGTTVRQLEPPTTPQILISDTVGFINRLPHELVASFRSTLQEAKYGQLLLIVVDVSDPAWRDHLRVTRETLDSIGASEIPVQIVLNKVDRIGQESAKALEEELPEAIQVSAVDPKGVEMVRQAIIDVQDRTLSEENLAIPFSAGQLLGEIHDNARVIDITHTDYGTALRVRARRRTLDRLRSKIPSRAPIETVDDAVEAARIHGLELTTEEDDFDLSGLDFRVVQAEDEDEESWMLRIPRRDDVVESARTEARALRLIRPRIPVDAPDWQLYAEDLIAYPKVAGTPVWTVHPDDGLIWNVFEPTDVPECFVESTAETLAALQAIPESEAREAGLPVENIDEVRDKFREMLETTRSALNPAEHVFERWSKWIDDDSNWPNHRALVHGDFHAGHMLVDPEGALTGILDWTEISVSDPSDDLAGFLMIFGEPAFHRLLECFEKAGGRVWPGIAEHTRERVAFVAVRTAAWGLEHDDEGVLAHAETLLESFGGD